MIVISLFLVNRVAVQAYEPAEAYLTKVLISCIVPLKFIVEFFVLRLSKFTKGFWEIRP